MTNLSDAVPTGIGHRPPDAVDPHPGLVSFDEWFDGLIRKPDGGIYGKRAKQAFRRRYRLPVVEVGWCRLIDPVAAADRLREYAQHQDPARRGPGRPRLIAKG
jgi:hypothetical protein